ncbi:E22 family MetX-like putative esterase [Burkholderia sp. LMU1-1-1.1]|uniref:E22 family MetX-like putative esterase n=1 Tax=Burkholderia sp. LMU1-1-1.1 TaxID=3135266 RepID=UPI003427BB3D
MYRINAAIGTLALSLCVATAAHAYDGLVEKKVFTLPAYTTVGGKVIKDLRVGWESYGTLNAARDNVIVVPHFYSANSHVAGKYKADDKLPGYWDGIIGAGKPIDTDKYFVVSVDSLVNLNSKDGVTVTTGPASIDPDTGKPYGLSFPVVTIPDFVRVQKALLDTLGVRKVQASIGVSMGGLQSYEWAARYPEMVERVIAVDATASQSAYAIAALENWSGPIRVDQNWNNGDYYGGPEPLNGVAQAFFNVVVGARHPEYAAAAFAHKWAVDGKNPLDDYRNTFLVEKVLKDAGMARARATTDANHMLYMTKANQLFIAGTAGSAVDPGLKKIRAKTLVVQARTDLLFPPADAKAEAAKLNANGTPADYVEIDAPGGHLAGISDIAKAGDAIRAFLAK